ncbi:putative ribonuclease H-like domain-containing protein [Tanacetum coccineum]|uniref:Ribonuclease H-like domain-containing protein n=1 Tax=Tanacetum coccineum TaxID=301880 RepID=A0ABQ5IN67_9ASTR
MTSRMKPCLATLDVVQTILAISKGAKRYGDFATGVASGTKSMRTQLVVMVVIDKSFRTYQQNIVLGEIAIRELKKKLEIVQKEKDGIQLNVDKFEHASKSLNKLIECQIVDNCKKGLGYENYNVVPPPYTGNFMPIITDLSFTGLDEFVNEPVVENCKAMSSKEEPKGNPQIDLQDQGVIDSGCSRHMIGNMSYLTDYEEIDGGYVAFGGNPKGGKITGKDNNVLFNDTECIVLSLNFKLIDESQVLLRVPRKNNMYSVDLKNIVPKGGLTCLFAKATSDESKLWHRRLGHLNFKTMNKLVKGNLVRGLPSKLFENDQTCVACQKGKQHRASCKSKTKNSINLPLHLLHMDLFGPTFVKSLKKKMYCLVVTDDYSRFTWVFFLATKDETSGILKSFITGIENLVDHKVKVIRCDNGTKFKNREMNQFCEMKEAVNTACYVQNRVLVVKPHNKTPYELFHSRTPTLSFMRPFGCPVTILNTIDHLGKFDGKADEGFFVGYSLNSKAFRVFNSRTRIVEENLHIRFSESTPNVVGSGPDWLFDIDALTRTMNYEPIVAGTQSNGFAGTKASDNAGQARKETKHVKDYILLPLWTAAYCRIKEFSMILSKPSSDDGKKVMKRTKKRIVNVKTEPKKGYKALNGNNGDKNKASIGCHQGYTQEEGIDYRSSPLPQLSEYKALKLFLAMLHIKDFLVHQMDVKMAFFLWAAIEEEVYGMVNHQDLKIHTYITINDLAKWKIDQDLHSSKAQRYNIMLGTKIIVDDIIFGSTKKELCIVFENCMQRNFNRYYGELTYPSLMGLQRASRRWHNLSSRYKSVAKNLKKLGYRSQEDCKHTNVNSKASARDKMRHLKGQPKLILWYLKDSLFDLVAYTDSDYAGARLDRKSTAGAEYVVALSCCGQVVGKKSSQDSTASPREKINTVEDLRLLEEACIKIKTCEKIYMDVI